MKVFIRIAIKCELNRYEFAIYWHFKMADPWRNIELQLMDVGASFRRDDKKTFFLRATNGESWSPTSGRDMVHRIFLNWPQKNTVTRFTRKKKFVSNYNLSSFHIRYFFSFYSWHKYVFEQARRNNLKFPGAVIKIYRCLNVYSIQFLFYYL